MATPTWQVQGQYYENCSCDYVCPCLPAQMAVKPTQGSCTFAMAFQIERGYFGNVALDGLGFVLLGYTPEEMGKGNWSVGVIVDERATPEQRDAIAGIASGSSGQKHAIPDTVPFHPARKPSNRSSSWPTSSVQSRPARACA